MRRSKHECDSWSDDTDKDDDTDAMLCLQNRQVTRRGMKG